MSVPYMDIYPHDQTFEFMEAQSALLLGQACCPKIWGSKVVDPRC